MKIARIETFSNEFVGMLKVTADTGDTGDIGCGQVAAVPCRSLAW